MSSSELIWFKSSYSDTNGGNCIEVAADWRKSSYSDGQGDNCVEIATCPTTIHIRDSKDKDGGQFAVTPDAWSAFIAYATGG